MKPYRARSTARLIAFVAVLAIALIAIVVRLAQVQLVQGETFASAARENQIQLIPISAPRGLIVDRNGVVMVRSRPSFVCALIPSEVVSINDTLHQLAAVLHTAAHYALLKLQALLAKTSLATTYAPEVQAIEGVIDTIV